MNKNLIYSTRHNNNSCRIKRNSSEWDFLFLCPHPAPTLPMKICPNHVFCQQNDTCNRSLTSFGHRVLRIYQLRLECGHFNLAINLHKRALPPPQAEKSSKGFFAFLMAFLFRSTSRFWFCLTRNSTRRKSNIGNVCIGSFAIKEFECLRIWVEWWFELLKS